ncbi:hypothetical protein [Nostoc sp. UIC 10630]|uniref:hypothetical protein n=1 Tax=Nostoc sp. UIC 10630 TaxID=2100146 RepID=UPI0013D173B5|nr:hypothetical protein [Nostoc sp. UIC 10630]NEU84602.1 hypothetical protein [Nostoc sp. UIC 10630]
MIYKRLESFEKRPPLDGLKNLLQKINFYQSHYYLEKRIAAEISMSKIKTLLDSLENVIEFLELDTQQMSETDSMLEEVNKTLQLLKRYQDDLKQSQISQAELL